MAEITRNEIKALCYKKADTGLARALRTGMRQGEILGLQWGDIDWNGKFIEIRRASWLIGNGESLAYVKEQLGHHSIQITVDTYGHLIPDANRKAVNALDDSGWSANTILNVESVNYTQEIALPTQ